MDTSRRGLPCWAIAVLVAVGGAVQSEGVTWRRSCGETREELRPQEREELRPQGGWTDVDDVFRCSAEDYEAMAQTWVPGLQAEPAAGSRTVGGLLSTSANYIDRAVRPVHIFFETFGKTTLTGAYNLMKQLAKTPHVKVTFVGPVGKLIQKKDPATGERVIVYADQLLPAASNDVKGDLPDPALEGDKTYLAKQLRKYDRLQHNGTVWTERKSENVTVLWDFAVSESEMKSLGAAGVEFVPCRPRRYFWSVKSNTAVRQMLPRLFLTDGGENPEGSTWVFREQDNRDWPRQFLTKHIFGADSLGPVDFAVTDTNVWPGDNLATVVAKLIWNFKVPGLVWFGSYFSCSRHKTWMRSRETSVVFPSFGVHFLNWEHSWNAEGRTNLALHPDYLDAQKYSTPDVDSEKLLANLMTQKIQSFPMVKADVRGEVRVALVTELPTINSTTSSQTTWSPEVQVVLEKLKRNENPVGGVLYFAMGSQGYQFAVEAVRELLQEWKTHLKPRGVALYMVVPPTFVADSSSVHFLPEDEGSSDKLISRELNRLQQEESNENLFFFVSRSPQKELFQMLRENEYKTFYACHGGGASLSEAIGYAVPVLCVPMLGHDQRDNCWHAERVELGVNLSEVTKKWLSKQPAKWVGTPGHGTPLAVWRGAVTNPRSYNGTANYDPSSDVLNRFTDPTFFRRPKESRTIATAVQHLLSNYPLYEANLVKLRTEVKPDTFWDVEDLAKVFASFATYNSDARLALFGRKLEDQFSRFAQIPRSRQDWVSYVNSGGKNRTNDERAEGCVVRSGQAQAAPPPPPQPTPGPQPAPPPRPVPPLFAESQLVIQHAGLNALCQSPDVVECRQWTRTQRGGRATATTTNAPNSSNSTSTYVSVDMKKNAGAPGNNNGAGDVDGFTIELDLPAGAFYDGRYPGVPAYRSGKYIVKSRRLRPSYVRRLNLDQFSPIRSQRVGWADAELTLPGARTSASTVPIFLKFDELDFRNVDLAKGFLHNAEKISDVCHRVALGMTSLPAFPSLEKEAGGVQGGVVEGERMRRFLRMRPVPAPTILSVIGEPGKETGCGFLTIMAKADDDELSTPKPPTAPGPRTSSVLARRSMPLSDVLRAVKSARQEAGHTTTTFLQRRGAGAPGAAGRPRRPANTTTTRTPASIAADFDDALQALYTDSTSTSTDFVQGLYAELVRNLRTLDRSGFLYLDLHGLNMLVHFELLEVEDPSQPPAAPPAAAPLVQQVRYEVSLVDYKTLLYMRSAQKNFGGRDDSSLAALNDHTSGGRRDSRLLHEELQFEVTRTAPTHLPAAPALQPRPQTVRSLYAVRNLPNQWGGTGAHIKNLFYHLRHSRRDPNNAGRSCTAYGDELYPWDQWAPDAVPTGPMADEPVAYDLISGIMEDIAFTASMMGQSFTDLLSSGQKEEIEIAVLEEDIAAGVYQHIPADACYAAPAGGPQPREEMDRNRIRERNSCLRERTQ